MSTYRPKGSSIFLYDFWLNEVRYYGSTKCKSKRAAEKYEEKLRAEIVMDDGKRKKPLITLDQAAANYEAYLRADGKWTATQDYLIANVVDGLGGDRFLSDISEQDLRDHFAKRAAAVSASSVNREIEVARPIWRRHMRSHEVGEMPEWGKLFFTVREKDARELFYDEEDRLIPELREDHADFQRFALISGWRLSEITELLRSKVNLGQAIAETRIKGGAWVKRALSAEMVAIIARQKKAGPFVFTYVCKKSRKEYVDKLGRKHPARLVGERYKFTKTCFRRDFKRALTAAKIENFRFHDFRHTRGTRIQRQTGDIAITKEALKHKHVKTTMRYVHASDDDVRRGLEASESRNITENRVVGNENSRKRGKN